MRNDLRVSFERVGLRGVQLLIMILFVSVAFPLINRTQALISFSNPSIIAWLIALTMTSIPLFLSIAPIPPFYEEEAMILGWLFVGLIWLLSLTSAYIDGVSKNGTPISILTISENFHGGVLAFSVMETSLFAFLLGSMMMLNRYVSYMNRQVDQSSNLQ